MGKFTAENIMHLLMEASQRSIKKTINEATRAGLTKEQVERLAQLEMVEHRGLIDEMHELVKNPRGFEVAHGFEDKGVKLPKRATILSAGYDFRALSDVTIEPHKTAKVKTGVKAYMMGDEALMLYPRSSMGIKRGINLANGVAVIDADYYNNKDNDGHIIICLYNMTDTQQVIKAGERIAQGVFTKYHTAGDIPCNVRTGGTGSTDA